MRKYTPLNLKQLMSVPEKRIALLVACWHEPAIGRMLEYNLNEIKYDNYDVFVGVYPNDPDTIEIIKEVQKFFPNVYCVYSALPGPTTKARNLNSMYEYIKRRERANQFEYEIFVMHDTEDVIDPISFKLYNYIIPRKDMVQLPVIPLPVSLKYITHWTYNDEFAEIHTKDLVARELINGFIPSAGVGTGFSKHAIRTLAEHNHGEPFSLFSLTEDYSCALKLGTYNLKTIFMVFWIPRVVEKRSWLLLGKKVFRTVKTLAATRSLRIMEYTLSVRQRTRWTIGIAFQEWYYSGWPGRFAIKYTLFHDRKALVTHIINMCGYVLLIYWLTYYIWSMAHPGVLTLEMMLHLHPWMWYLIIANTFYMANRIIQRIIGCYRVYGTLAAFTSPFRIIFANVLYAHVLVRAYIQFFGKQKPKPNITTEIPKWDKTANYFPSDDLLAQYKWNVGDLLLENKQVIPEQLVNALKLQSVTGEKIGKILIDQKYIDSEDLLSALALQNNLELVDADQVSLLTYEHLKGIDRKIYDWLIEQAYFPIDLEDNHVYIAFEAIPQAGIKNSIRAKLKPYQVKFMLLDNQRKMA